MLIEKGDGAVEQPKMDLVGTAHHGVLPALGHRRVGREARFPRDYSQDYVWVTGLDGYELGREPFPARADEHGPPQSPLKRERMPQDMFDPILHASCVLPARARSATARS